MAKHNPKLAKRYARALFESCDREELERFEQALGRLVESCSAGSDAATAFMNPAYPLPQRVEAARAVAEAMVPGEPRVANFVGLLVDNGRFPLLPEIAVIFSELVAEVKKLLTLEVTSAFPVPEDERRALLEKLQQEHGKMAAITWRVDSEILGGLMIRAGDKLYDTSLRSSLERARSALSAGGAATGRA